MLLACVDVHYVDTTAVAGCLLFREWADSVSQSQLVTEISLVEPYKAGQFYLRELPPILAVLEKIDVLLTAIIVDGYAWLGGEQPGLGARLHEALAERVPIVGVAKTSWGGPSAAGQASDNPKRTIPIIRGHGARPLYVTAAGLDVAAAAMSIQRMHGEHRIPTLLKAVDRLVRSTKGGAI